MAGLIISAEFAKVAEVREPTFLYQTPQNGVCVL